MKKNEKKPIYFGAIIFIFLFSVCVYGFSHEKELYQKNRIEKLIEQLELRNWRETVDALTEIGESAVPPLVQVLEKRRRTKDNSVKSWILPARIHYALVRIGSKDAIAAVSETLLDEQANENIRIQAAMAVRDSRSDTFIPSLRKAFRSNNDAVRWKVVEAMFAIGAEKSEEIFLEALLDEYLYVRGEATKGLGSIRSIKAAGLMAGNFKDESWQVRLETRNALVRIGKPAEDVLIKSLKHKDSRTQWQAAWVLGEIQSEKGALSLVEVLEDENWMVRDEAAVALAKIHSKSAVESLIVALKDKRVFVQNDAAWVLGEMKSEDAVDALVELLNVKDSSQAAVAALEKIGNLNALRAVEQYLSEIETKKPESDFMVHREQTFPLYPQSLEANPGIPSPYKTKSGWEIVLAYTTENKFVFFPVTVENGRPYVYTQSGKGRQLDVDALDFPALARTGLHSEQDFEQTKTITGRSIVEITELGRPGRSSGAGFMAEDEDIISVLKGDNRLVYQMGLTHKETARSLFHIWNIFLKEIEDKKYGFVKHVLYNGHKVFLKMIMTKGWQESLFNDEIYGGAQLDIRRELDEEEKKTIEEEYAFLNEQQKIQMIEKLSHIHIGEMVPYYIQRYGFYEGHTDYRADPVAIAFIFGLKSLEEINHAFGGELDKTLKEHFIRERRPI